MQNDISCPNCFDNPSSGFLNAGERPEEESCEVCNDRGTIPKDVADFIKTHFKKDGKYLEFFKDKSPAPTLKDEYYVSINKETWSVFKIGHQNWDTTRLKTTVDIVRYLMKL